MLQKYVRIYQYYCIIERCLSSYYITEIVMKQRNSALTSIDVLLSKNQALCEYCTQVSNY